MPNKDKKKKLIRVKLAKNIETPYRCSLNGTNMHYAFIGADEETTTKGFRRKRQISAFVTCREFLCSIPRSVVHPSISNSYIDPKNVKFDFDRLRLLIGVGRQANFEEERRRLFSGKRALNLLEEAAGWKEPSVITTVKHEDYTDDKMWLLTGPGEWIYAPQLLSLAGLIMRLAHKVGPLETDTLDDLFKHFDEISKMKGEYDFEYIAGVRKHILTILEKYKMLFSGELQNRYPDKGVPGFNGYGGISSLIKCATGDDKLDKRVRNLILKPKKEKTLKK